MTEQLSNYFDEYTIKARVIPALVAFFPILIFPLLLTNHNYLNFSLTALAEMIILIPLLTLLAGIMQAAGNKYQEKLIKKWNGLPSTRYLRANDPTFGQEIKQELYKKIEKVFSVSIAGKNDNEINSVFDRIKSFLRKHSPQGLYQQHNISYGFYRNLAGMRWYSLSAVIIVAVVYLMLVKVNVTEIQQADYYILFLMILFQLFSLFSPYLCKINAEHYARESLNSFLVL